MKNVLFMNYLSLTATRKFSSTSVFGLLLFLLFQVFPSKAQQAPYTLQSGDLVINDKGVITACSYNFANKRIIIPTSIDGKDIKVIGNDSHTSIFYDKGLISVSFPIDSKVTSIGFRAFYKNNLQSVVFPPGLTYIGNSAFGRNSLTSVDLPDRLTAIGQSVFESNNLTSVTIPSSMTNIGRKAFLSNLLTSVTFSENSEIQSIRINAFANNPNLAPIKFPIHDRTDFVEYRDNKGNSYSPADTFYDFSFAYYAFFNYYELTANDITINENGAIVECICWNLPSKIIKIPVSVDGQAITGIFGEKHDRKRPFWGKNVISVLLPDDSKLVTLGYRAFADNSIASFNLPDGLITIGNFAFDNNDLASVDLPEGLTTIENSAFDSNALTSVDFPASLTTIGASAFSYNFLTRISFPENSKLATIKFGSFYNNDITTVDFPASLDTIGIFSFGFNDITSVDFPENSKLVAVERQAFFHNDITSLNLPTSLISIGESAFLSNQLESVSFTENSKLETIEKKAFFWNRPLKSITLPIKKEEGKRYYWTKDGLEEEIDPIIIDFEPSYHRKSIDQIRLTISKKLRVDEAFLEGEFGEVEGLQSGVNWIDKGVTFDLVASANAGYRFVEWEIENQIETSTDYSLSSTQTNADVNVTAYFVEQVTLEVSVNDDEGQTSAFPEPNSGSLYDKGTIIDLAATAFDGYRFDKWVIDREIIRDPTTTVTLDADKEAVAYFVEQVTLIASVNDDIGGSISPPDGVFTVDKVNPASTKTLTASAFDDYRFDKWVIDREIIRDPTTTVTLDADKEAVAYFVEQVTLRASVNDDIGGSVSPPDGFFTVDKVNPALTKTLTASAFDGYRFDKWVIDREIIRDPTTTVTLDADKEAVAYFVEQVTLRASVYDDIGGSIYPPDGVFTVDKANPAPTNTLTASAFGGYRFDKWVIDREIIRNPTTTVTLDVDKEAVAYFVEQVKLRVTVNYGIGGVVTSYPTSNFGDNYDKGAQVHLTALGSDGYRFDKWVIDGTSFTDQNIAVILDTDKSATAYFVEQVTLTVRVNEDRGGQIITTPSAKFNNLYDIRTVVNLIAKPSVGYRFDKWVIGGVTVVVPITGVTLIGDEVAEAYFVEQVALTVNVDEGNGGNISPREGIFMVDKINPAPTQQLTAIASAGYRFEKWIIGDVTITNVITTVTLDLDKSATAYFVEDTVLNNNIGKPNIITPHLNLDYLNNKLELYDQTATSPDNNYFDEWNSANFLNENSIPDLEDGQEQIVSFYPNPMSTKLTVVAEVGDKIELLSEVGIYVYSAEHWKGIYHKIDVSHLLSGVYFLKITGLKSRTIFNKVLKISGG